MLNILCPTPSLFSKKGLEYAASKGNLVAREMTQQEFDNVASGYDVLLVRFKTRVGENIFRSPNSVRAVLSPTTGIDHLDIEAIELSGATVFHLRNERSFLTQITGTAELALGLMLALARNIVPCINDTRNGIWLPDQHRGVQLQGKTVGIVGLGRLGSMMAAYTSALGMRVLAFDPYRESCPPDIKMVEDLRDLMSQAAFVSLHVPLTERTKHMIGTEELSQMSNRSFLINTSRGAIIDEDALLGALEKHTIAGAALDVLDGEIDGKYVDHPLIKFANRSKNCIITSHIGGATFDSVEKTDLHILDKYFNYLEHTDCR